MTAPASSAKAPPSTRPGVMMGLGAYFLWGFLPVYFHLLSQIAPGEMVAQRILWSVLVLAVLAPITGQAGAIMTALGTPRLAGALLASAALIGGNWLIYIWAVTSGHVVASSLGYFLNPLINVLLGVLVLRERLSRMQIAAILIAATGVGILAIGEYSTLWISLSLGISFALYGLIRKLTPVSAIAGLGVETILLAPLALGWMAILAQGPGSPLAHPAGIYALIAISGVITAVPLILFAGAARRVPMVVLGLMQFTAPTIQFLLGVFVYHERLSPERWASFGLIWAGLALFAGHAFHTARQARMAPTAV